MKLYDLLELIGCDEVPLIADENGIVDCRPNSVFRITIRFMSEEETAETVNLSSPLLIPWYDCNVHAISPNDIENSMDVWLEYDSYIESNWPDKVNWRVGAQ